MSLLKNKKIIKIALCWATAGLLTPLLWWQQRGVGSVMDALHLPVHLQDFIFFAVWPFGILLIGIGPETPMSLTIWYNVMSFALNAAYFMCLGLLLYGVWSLLQRCFRRTR